MKKYLIIALLAVGCASSTPAASTTPTPEPQAEAANPYLGVVGLLETLIDYSPEQYAAFCNKIQGVYASDAEGYHTCSRSDDSGQAAGFALEFDGVNPSPISVLIVPGTEGQTLAEAIVEEVGNPDFVLDNVAVWDLGEFRLVFSPVPGGPFLVGLERAGTAL